VVENGLAALVADVSTDERFSQSQSMVSAGIRSLLAAPLLDAEGCLGMIAMASRLAVRQFTEEDMALLVSLASLAALRIRNLTLMEEAAESLRNHNVELERKVAERTAELAAKNQELERKNEAILRTQNQLIIQEKMAALGTMAAGVAHQIKNPLNFVKNLSEVSGEMFRELEQLVGDGPGSTDAEYAQNLSALLEDLRRNAEIINHHSRRADRIVVNLMEYTNEPGKSNRQCVEVNPFLEKYIGLACESYSASRADLDLQIEWALGPQVGGFTVFPNELSRALVSIVENAIDAMWQARQRDPARAAALTITSRGEPDRVIIVIRDNGTGIPADQLDKVFTPFFSTKHEVTNIGLGLSLAYDTITQRLGGKLDIQSEDGQYTEVTVVVPREVES
jgi:signal transduction histidine kinase